MRSALIWMLVWIPTVAWSDSAVDRIAEHRHLGVASCASSVCHGATQPFRESNVMQNEFAYWQEFDPHATRAFQSLSSAEGQVARKSS